MPSDLREPIHGVDLDPEGRCRHWHGPTDIVAIRFPCCDRYFACHACHDDLAGHAPARWPRAEFHRLAILCGACRQELSIADYIAADDCCPACRAPFNPRCRLHHPLYFEV